MEWKKAICVAKDGDVDRNVPTPRSGHTLALLGSHVFLFGGLADSAEPHPNNDLFMLRPRAASSGYEWSRIESSGDAPPPRWRHTASKISDTEFVVFGGYVSPLTRCFNDLWVFNAVTTRWRQPVPQSSDCVDGLYSQTGWANQPSPRGAHAAAVLDSHLYVIGGHGGDDSALDHLDDLAVLDTTTWTWKAVVPTGKGPGKRSGHGGCAINNLIYVHGGWNSERQFGDLFVLDPHPPDPHWTRIETEMAPRCFHASIAIESRILVFGGFGGFSSDNYLGSYFGSTAVFDVDEPPQWTVQKEADHDSVVEPRSEADMVLLRAQGIVMLFGGYANKWYGDAFTLEVA